MAPTREQLKALARKYRAAERQHRSLIQQLAHRHDKHALVRNEPESPITARLRQDRRAAFLEQSWAAISLARSVLRWMKAGEP